MVDLEKGKGSDRQFRRRPLILVTNDDGIMSPGIRELTRALVKLGDVVVIAQQVSKVQWRTQSRWMIQSGPRAGDSARIWIMCEL